jgi:hypothetical protein
MCTCVFALNVFDDLVGRMLTIRVGETSNLHFTRLRGIGEAVKLSFRPFSRGYDGSERDITDTTDIHLGILCIPYFYLPFPNHLVRYSSYPSIV